MNISQSSIQALQQQRLLLQLEYETEKEAYRRQTETVGIGRKVKRGDAWWPLRVGKSYYNSLNQLAVEVFRTTDTDIEHNFEFGRPVAFFTIVSTAASAAAAQPIIRYFRFTGTVSYVDGDRMVITVADNAPLIDLQGAENVGLQLSFDETSYRLMTEALDRAIRGKGRLGYLRDLFNSRQKPETLTFQPMHFPYLNPSQEQGVNDKMLSFTYERRFEAHPDYPQLWALRKAIRELRSHRRRGDEKYHQRLESLKSRATELEIRINNDLFGEARVIASTLVGSANRLLDGQKFATLFIDEAAQALEAACWIPLRRVSRVVLAGDHCQLPPTVKSIAALKAGLGKTLMERISEMHPEAVTLLRLQYRMNDAIMRFSSDYFYDSQVESAPEVRFRGILDLDTPMEWIDTAEFADKPDSEDNAEKQDSQPLSFREEFVGESYGRINKAEARLTLDVLQHYFERISKQRLLDERIDVGIISPYRAQVQYLRRLLMGREFFKPFRRHISVNTVDGFQGQERDVIVISLVRSNAEGQIGFLRDLRRMNVAITRARMKVIILGDRHTLTRHPFYRQLWQYIQALHSGG